MIGIVLSGLKILQKVTIMSNQLISVPFHDQTLSAALKDSIPYVAMKPICENLGIQWEGQL